MAVLWWMEWNSDFLSMFRMSTLEKNSQSISIQLLYCQIWEEACLSKLPRPQQQYIHSNTVPVLEATTIIALIARRNYINSRSALVCTRTDVDNCTVSYDRQTRLSMSDRAWKGLPPLDRGSDSSKWRKQVISGVTISFSRQIRPPSVSPTCTRPHTRPHTRSHPSPILDLSTLIMVT